MNGGFVSFTTLVLLFLWMQLLHCSAFYSCIPKKDLKFLYFFVTATAFLTVLVRLTRLKVRVTRLHSSHVLLGLMESLTKCLEMAPGQDVEVWTGELAATR